MTKFKVGPAKTRGKNAAVIFEVSDRIYGKVLHKAESWNLDGQFFEDDKTRSSGLDLVPNVEPFRFEAKVCWQLRDLNVVPLWSFNDPFGKLVGKKGTLTFVEDLE